MCMCVCVCACVCVCVCVSVYVCMYSDTLMGTYLSEKTPLWGHFVTLSFMGTPYGDMVPYLSYFTPLWGHGFRSSYSTSNYVLIRVILAVLLNLGV